MMNKLTFLVSLSLVLCVSAQTNSLTSCGRAPNAAYGESGVNYLADPDQCTNKAFPYCTVDTTVTATNTAAYYKCTACQTNLGFGGDCDCAVGYHCQFSSLSIATWGTCVSHKAKIGKPCTPGLSPSSNGEYATSVNSWCGASINYQNAGVTTYVPVWRGACVNAVCHECDSRFQVSPYNSQWSKTSFTNDGGVFVGCQNGFVKKGRYCESFTYHYYNSASGFAPSSSLVALLSSALFLSFMLFF